MTAFIMKQFHIQSSVLLNQKLGVAMDGCSYLELWGSSELRTQDLMENCSRKSFNLHTTAIDACMHAYACMISWLQSVKNLLVAAIDIIHKEKRLSRDKSEKNVNAQYHMTIGYIRKLNELKLILIVSSLLQF